MSRARRRRPRRPWPVVEPAATRSSPITQFGKGFAAVACAPSAAADEGDVRDALVRVDPQPLILGMRDEPALDPGDGLLHAAVRVELPVGAVRGDDVEKVHLRARDVVGHVGHGAIASCRRLRRVSGDSERAGRGECGERRYAHAQPGLHLHQLETSSLESMPAAKRLTSRRRPFRPSAEGGVWGDILPTDVRRRLSQPARATLLTPSPGRNGLSGRPRG